MTCSYPEGVRGAQVELLPDFLGGSGTQSVEDVVVSLLLALSADPRLLQQVVGHEAAHDGVLSTQTPTENTFKEVCGRWKKHSDPLLDL